jgi:5-methylcytosine-specific restriction endonuclease McrA
MVDRKRTNNKANNGGKWIRPEKRRAIYIRDNLGCLYCGLHIDDGIELTLDHVLPTELGGTNSERNLGTACKQCNCAKGKKTLRQFLAYLRDRGVDTDGMAKRIQRQLNKKLRKENMR